MTPRVLFTASTASHILNFHLPYLRRLKELGCAVDVACGGGGEIPCADKVISLPLRKAMTSPANFKAASALRRLYKAEHYDLVVTHTSLAAFFTRLALPKKGRPAVVNMVHGYLFNTQSPRLKDRLLMAAESLTAKKTDLLLTMNAQDLSTAQARHWGEKVDYIPGIGVDFSRLDAALKEDKAALRRELGVPAEAFVFLYAAEFSHRKNQSLLIRALAQLPEQALLILPGQGGLLEECRDLAQSLSVGHRVLFPGQIRDMAPWYALADAGVTASRSEGLPFNVMEAMYAGLPVAATAVKGHTDLIASGSTGLLYPLDDEDRCAQALRQLMEDPQLCRALGDAAHRAVLPYGLPQVLPQVLAHYQAFLPVPAQV